jgi:hypothetical protein
LPLWHSPAAVHAKPFGFFPQLPPLQTFGATHWELSLQLDRHATTPQWMFPHGVVPPDLHVPAPSQVDGFVWTSFEQLPAAQTVPEP